jgi:glutamyl-tRNA synthetase
MADAALADLEWLGLDWDGAPHLQSTGVERLRDSVEALLESSRAYACVCSRADIRSAASAPQAGDVEIRYPATCRGLYASVEHAHRSTGKAVSVRFVTPEEPVELLDDFVGPVRFDPHREVGDFMIARRDGAPAYQLAVVLDDAHQGVTEVLRQGLLQRALGLLHPRWVHVPLVCDEHGRRFAKRRDDLSLAELRERGVDPRAVVGWVAASSGMTVPDRVTAHEALSAFRLELVPKAPVRLTPQRVNMLKESR